MNDVADLIERLGGGTRIAADLAAATGTPVDREAVYKWQERGIPWKWRPSVADLAKEKGLKLGPKFYAPAPRRPGKRRAA